MQPASRPEAGASGRRRLRAPVLPAAATVVVAAAAVAMAVAAVAVTTLDEAWQLAPGPQLAVDATVGATCPAVGSVMVLAGRLDAGARLLARVLVGAGAFSAAAALTTALAMTAVEPTDTARLWSQLQSCLWVPGFLPLLTLVPLLYPSGLLPGRVWRRAATSSVAGIVALGVGIAAYDEPLVGRATVPKLVVVPVVAQALTVLAAVLLLPSVVAALSSLVVRYRAADGLARRQVLVLLGAAAVLVGVTAVQGPLPAPLDVLVQAGAVALVPLAIGVAVTRHRLYDLDLALCRTLVAASLAVCLVGAYLSVFTILRAVLEAGGHGGSVLSAAVAAGVTGAVVQPLGRQLAAGVDRLYYGHRADPYAVTTRLAATMTAPDAEVTAVPAAVCRTVVEELRLSGARVWVAPDASAASADDGPTIVAAMGDLDDAASRRFPMTHRGETVGQLEASPRVGEQRLDERDAVVLQGVADQAAPAVAALSLQRALQRSRESIVAARETERRWLRQELHDGLGATLAGLRLQVETAHDLTRDDTTVDLLAAAGRGVATAVAEVRTICEGLRPPGIDELGLPGALRALAERVQRPGLLVEVRVDEVRDLAPAVEVALYRIAAEALTNAARHAGAAVVVLRVSAGDRVDLLVEDDGIGLDGGDPAGATAGSGLGIASMRQRAEEVGGRLQVVPGAAGGTVVRAVLPVAVGGAT